MTRSTPIELAAPRPRISRHVLILLLFVADLAALGYGIFRRPAPPIRSFSIDREAEKSPVAVLAGSEGEAWFILLDDDGRPRDVSALSLDVRGVASLQGRTYVLDARGLNRIYEPAPRTLGETVTGRNAEVERFLPFPEPYTPEGAASEPSRLVAIGFDVSGAAREMQFDGIEMSSVPLAAPAGFTALGGGALGPARAAIVAAKGHGFAVALRDDRNLFVGFVGGDAVRWSEPLGLSTPEGAPTLVRDDLRGGFVALQPCNLAASESAITRIRFEDGGPGAPPTVNGRDSIPLRRGETIAGVLPRSHAPGRPLSVLLRSGGNGNGGGIRALDVGGEPPAGASDAPVPVVLAAWNTRALRFKEPLLFHFAIYLVASLLVRRRPIILERRFISFRLAPLVRRGLAFLVDVVFAFALAVCLRWMACDEPEIRYVASRLASLQEAGPEPFLADAIVAGLVLDLLLAFLLSLTMLIPLAEALTSRSLGKRLFRLHVIAVDGERPSVGAMLTRGMMLYVDVLQVPFPIGVLFVLFTRRRQRLGDLFAGTVVVLDGSVSIRTSPPPVEAGRGAKQTERFEPPQDGARQ